MALTLLHRQRRLQWARTARRWQRRDWDMVLFTDESRFNMFRNGHPFGGGGVMVWGGICGPRTRLIIIIIIIHGNHLTGQRYRDEVLRPAVVPFLRQQPMRTLLHRTMHNLIQPDLFRIISVMSTYCLGHHVLQT